MQITDIRIRHVAAEGKLRAYVTVTFDDCFVVHNVKIIEGKTGVFIAMPSRKTKTGEYKDVAHPIHSGFRNELQEQILAAFRASEPSEPPEEDEPLGQPESSSGAETSEPESIVANAVEE